MKKRILDAKVWGAAAFVLSIGLFQDSAWATYVFGNVQITGNLETQNLMRLDRDLNRTFQTFDLVQQRNTARLQYEHDLQTRTSGILGSDFRIPGVKSVDFFMYYRFVYDSVYDIRPGPRFREQTGGVAGSFDTFTDAQANALRFENRIREVFLDVDLSDLPVSFRIGRQQIVWGNTVNFRALDSANALDLSWHMQQEAGILGRVGFSELRIPAWAIKMLVNIGSLGPLSSTYLEAYDIPFEFEPTRATFYPRPWGLRIRDPFRAGLALDLGEAATGVPSGIFAQPCFDFTGTPQGNAAAGADFSETAQTGKCPAEGLQRSKASQGLYDRHDPMDVNQVGARFGGQIPALQSLGFTLNYMYRRHIADATGGGAAKAQVGALNANVQDFITVAPHETTDPLTGETTQTIGFLRIPVEFYYPYIHVFGIGLDYFEEYSGAVLNLEVAASKGVPISTADGTGNGLNRKWEMEAALLVDRPTWIRFLNPRSTFTTLFQTNVSFLPGHEGLKFDEDGNLIDGDVGVPNSALIPEQFGAVSRVDERHQYEVLSILAMQTFYKGGSVSPLFAFIWDWTNMPGAEVLLTLQYLPTPSIILEPTLRVFWTDGRIVDDRYGVTQNAGRSELQLKATFQF